MNDKIVIPIWAVGMFIIVSNTTMFNVSIPSLIRELDITADLSSWIISSYSIGYALSTVIFSRLSDMIPIRRLLLIGLTVLGLSSVYGVFAGDFYSLLAARILQSAGAGSMAGLGLVMASRYIPPERRGRAITMMSTGNALAFGLGPIIGGLITQYFGINSLFAVTCLILIVLPLLMKLLPKELPSSGAFDAWGAVLTVVNAAALLIAVTQKSALWLSLSLLSFLLHGLHMKRKKEPFIHPELLKVPGFGKLMASGFLILMINMGNLFLMPLVLADWFDKPPMAVGLFIAPGAVLSASLTRWMGVCIDRYGSIRVLLATQVILASVLVLFAAGSTYSPFVILFGYLLFSPCLTASLASLNNEASRLLPKKWIGSGMGLLQMVQFFGGSISAAACGILLEHLKDGTFAYAYRVTYALLLTLGLGALFMLLWYRLSFPREENSHKQAQA